jgi:hypothetical protein
MEGICEGIEQYNYSTWVDELFEKMAKGKTVNPAASQAMIDILLIRNSMILFLRNYQPV